MADQTQRLEIATVRAEVGSNILFRFSNDAANESLIPTESGEIKSLKRIILDIQDDAAEKISIATTIYPTVEKGLLETEDQSIFLVESNGIDEIYTVWKNNSGTGVDTGKRAISSQAVLDAVVAAGASADEAGEAADAAKALTEGIIPPTSTPPSTRTNGEALEIGDTYFNTETQTEFAYTIDGWSEQGSRKEELRLEDSIYRVADKVSGSSDLLLDSQSGLLMSSLQERNRSAGIFIVGDEEKLTFDTLYNRVRFGFEISKQVDILEGAEGHNDRRAFPEIQTLPDSTQALIFLKKDGTAALTVDTVNNKLTTDFSFESNVEQRPPTVFVDVPPRIERNTADPFYRLSGRVYQATATIARTGATRFWTAWRADNTNAAEVPGNFTVMAYSDDDCETVTEYGYLTYSPAGPDKHMVDPMLWLDPAGRLWLFFGCMGNNKGFDGVQGTWAIICQNPNAQFPVWGQAFRLSYYGDPRRPIEVNGQWYIALDGWRHSASSPLRYMDAAGPHIHRIDWQRQKLEHISQLPPNNGSGYSGFFETEFMQRSDGSVLALCRSLSASVETKFSVSTDLMKTWSAWADYTVISPSSSSRMWLGRSPSGRTVFCWNNDTVRRTLTLGISDNDGATYPYKVVLEPNETGQVTYPIVAFGDGGAIYVIYDNERTSGKRQIRIAKVIESEIVAGTSVPVVNIVSNPFA